MIKILDFYFVNFMGTLFLLIFIYYSDLFNKKTTRYYLWAAFFNILLIICDACKLVNQDPSLPPILRTLPYSLAFIMRVNITLSLAIIAMRDTKIVKGARWWFFIPATINAIVALASNWIPLVFSLNADYSFNKESLYFIPFLASGFYLVWLVIMIKRIILSKESKEGIGLIGSIVLSSIATVLEAWGGYVALLTGACMIGITFYFVALHGSMGLKDTLTGCYTRAKLYSDIDDMSITAIVIADMNDLKLLNDTKGHSAGDKALVDFAELLHGIAYTGCKVYRIGGDEFCIICTSLSEHLVRSMISDIQEMAKLRKISCAMGYSMTSADMDIYDVYKKADQMMYDDKSRMKGSDHGKTENSDS